MGVILEFLAIISFMCLAIGLMGVGMAAAEKIFGFAYDNVPALKAWNTMLFGDVLDE